MNVALGTMRILLAVWLCIGTQLHIAVDHTAQSLHAAHHANDPHRNPGGPAGISFPHDDQLCCYHTPHHDHHDNGTSHPHMAEAASPNTVKRHLPLPETIATLHVAPERRSKSQPGVAFPPLARAAAAPAFAQPSLRAPPVA